MLYACAVWLIFKLLYFCAVLCSVAYEIYLQVFEVIELNSVYFYVKHVYGLIHLHFIPAL